MSARTIPRFVVTRAETALGVVLPPGYLAALAEQGARWRSWQFYDLGELVLEQDDHYLRIARAENDHGDLLLLRVPPNRRVEETIYQADDRFVAIHQVAGDLRSLFAQPHAPSAPMWMPSKQPASPVAQRVRDVLEALDEPRRGAVLANARAQAAEYLRLIQLEGAVSDDYAAHALHLTEPKLQALALQIAESITEHIAP